MANHLLHESPGMIDDIPGERLDVTVVLPCYNEQNHVVNEIERITEALDQSSLRYELLVIDDCSTDQTLETVQRAQARFPYLRVMPFHRNSGSGTARRVGTNQARGDIVVWTDADMTYPNERIPEFVELLAKDPTIDQVVGARTSEQGTHKILRIPAKWFIRKAAERLSGSRIPDLNSGFRAFRTDIGMWAGLVGGRFPAGLGEQLGHALEIGADLGHLRPHVRILRRKRHKDSQGALQRGQHFRPADDLGKMRRANFFFAFSHKNKIHRQLAACAADGVQRRQKCGFGAFLVNRTASHDYFAEAGLIDEAGFERR